MLPRHCTFIRAPAPPYDWRSSFRSSQEINLWQGGYGTNNPCPFGFRLPTDAEWEIERASWSPINDEGALSSPLKLVLAGRRGWSHGLIDLEGVKGFYWSSSVDGSNSRYMLISDSSTTTRININYRSFGYSIRCIKD